MRYIQAGFVGEGSSDHEFLPPLLHRVLYELLFDLSVEEYELPNLVSIYPSGKSSGNRPASIVREVVDNFDYLDVVFYHSDAGGNADAAYRERVIPVVEGLRDTGISVVGVVPRREVEAWVIADSVALCEVLGLDPTRAPVPAQFSPSQVEGCTDPKADLRSFLQQVQVKRFKPVGENFSFYGSLALTARVDVLRGIPQFAVMLDDIKMALSERGLV